MVAGTGPLAGLRVVELAAIGPTPHAAMVLADLGAEVIRVDRPSTVRTLRIAPDGAVDTVLRGRSSVCADGSSARLSPSPAPTAAWSLSVRPSWPPGLE